MSSDTALLAVLCCIIIQPQPSEQLIDGGLNQRLLVVSFDGFSQRYFDTVFDDLPDVNVTDVTTLLPTMLQFRSLGASANNVSSVFPSDTFPNHHSISTGKWPESHGIVANYFYDPDLNATFQFDLSSTDPRFWSEAEPIWITAKKQGKSTAVINWPGSVIAYSGLHPDYYIAVYNPNVPFTQQINNLTSWMGNGDVDLAMLYFNQPDIMGHALYVEKTIENLTFKNDFSGPGSTEVDWQLHQNDNMLKTLLNQLESIGLGPDNGLNIIVLSDHGMTMSTQWIWLGSYINIANNIARIPNSGSVTSIFVQPGKFDKVYNSLKGGEVIAATGQRLFTVYTKLNMPPEFHYTNNDRISDLTVVCEPGIYMSDNGQPPPYVAFHGYDPRHRDMRPIFMARGPAFKTNGYVSNRLFHTMDIYALIAYIVGIDPPQGGINATLDSVADLLAS